MRVTDANFALLIFKTNYVVPTDVVPNFTDRMLWYVTISTSLYVTMIGLDEKNKPTPVAVM
jgi:hypothetical protein